MHRQMICTTSAVLLLLAISAPSHAQSLEVEDFGPAAISLDFESAPDEQSIRSTYRSVGVLFKNTIGKNNPCCSCSGSSQIQSDLAGPIRAEFVIPGTAIPTVVSAAGIHVDCDAVFHDAVFRALAADGTVVQEIAYTGSSDFAGFRATEGIAAIELPEIGDGYDDMIFECDASEVPIESFGPSAVSIDFDSLIDEEPIEDSFRPLGLLFTNAKAESLPCCACSEPNQLSPAGAGPIRIEFVHPGTAVATAVKAVGCHVDCDATFHPESTLTAYGPTGEVLGAVSYTGSGSFVGLRAECGISAIELSDSGDGYDDLVFDFERSPLESCQGVDAPDSSVLFVNGRNDLRVPVIAGNPLTFSLQGPPAGGNGKFIVHLNSGGPTGGDLTLLPAELGTACFPMLVPPNGTADPDAIWNNLGKVALVGASEYFGEPGEDPERAPTSFLQRVPGDPDNMPIGTTWTIQGVVVNPTGSSPKAVSLTNAVVFEVIQ